MDLRQSSILRQFATFFGVGAIATTFHYAVLFSLVEAVGIQPVTASLFGALVGAIVSYVLNRNITFQSTARHSKTAPKFFFTAFLAVVLNTVFMAFFTLTLRLPYPIAQVLTTGLLLIVTFGLNKFWSFKN